MNAEPANFGRFRLDVDRRELFRDGTPVQLGSRALDILCVLASANGEVVGKDELMRRVWPDVVVEEGNIQVHVSALRKALEDGKNAQTYVVTVPGRGYRLVGLQTVSSVGGSNHAGRTLTVPDKPSIAVLPFTNLSGDPEQEYFADGMVEEITTALSRIRWLFVIARNSSFIYKGRAVDVKQVGRELGVRYVLEGGVRKAANRVRITAQLIDVSSGAHLWADRFDGSLEDIFDLQDQVSASVVGAIARELEQAEIERAKRKPTESLDAYDYFLRGMANTHQMTREAYGEALRLFNKAIGLDPSFASAHGGAAYCYSLAKSIGWRTNREEIAEAARLARRAVELGKEDAVALAIGGIALAYVVGDVEDGGAAIDRALMLNPNLAAAWHFSGWVRVYLGEPDAAIEHLTHAMRLSPLDPYAVGMNTAMAFAHFFAGRYDEAWSWADRAARGEPRFVPAVRIAAASSALAGRLEDAQNCVTRLRQVDPTFRVSHVETASTLRRLENRMRFAEGLRIAGLPE
jgi:TolB-like protein/Tfp pilus assembly protein PilF